MREEVRADSRADSRNQMAEVGEKGNGRWERGEGKSENEKGKRKTRKGWLRPSTIDHRPSTKNMNHDEIRAAIAVLPGWSFEDDSLVKTFQFGSFREAVSFIVRLSFEAEERNHHPELANIYNRVEVRLRTHDAGNKVTELDLALAQAIENLSWV